jgi:hypothetical protein
MRVYYVLAGCKISNHGSDPSLFLWKTPLAAWQGFPGLWGPVFEFSDSARVVTGTWTLDLASMHLGASSPEIEISRVGDRSATPLPLHGTSGTE